MSEESLMDDVLDIERDVFTDLSGGSTELSRRRFLQALGAGLLITVTQDIAPGQGRSRGGGQSQTVVARLYLNTDGTITVLTGKVEEGQGARAELSQAAAEELGVPAERVRMIMADTDLVPDDGITAGSRTTPRNVPAVRRAGAFARELLTRVAAQEWQVDASTLKVDKGIITHAKTKKTMTYADLARSLDVAEAFKQNIPGDVAVTAVHDWDVMGQSVPRPNLRDLVTGTHHYPSDVSLPNTLYGKVLRAPSYGATLESVDLAPARAMQDVVVLREGQFVGCAAPSTYRATQALEAVARTAVWKTVDQVSSQDVFAHLKQHARTGGRSRGGRKGSIDKGLADAHKLFKQTYEVAYVQHTPMEPRAATVQWKDGKLTAWAGVDYPQRIQGDLARTFELPRERVRVIVPDMGGGFGGKHTGEAAEEAARLARAAKRPVAVHWTRADEFTWAYFRPAAVIECQAGLDKQGTLLAWDFTNINAGGSAIDAPYDIPNVRTRSLSSDSPLRQGAYRCLAATANNFARESFIDELAKAAGTDPLAFRLAHLNNPRIRKVLEAAAKHFDWSARKQKITPDLGVGLACGTEKDSVVAACVEVGIDRQRGLIKVQHVCEVFECGPVINPANLTSQVQGCISMGLGPALREQIHFANGRILNADFAGYEVPRFEDLPTIDVHLIENHSMDAVGGGETPIIAVAPAIGNAVFTATGMRLRAMPMQPALQEQI
jgi:isoquinoline 1-oxidoreductase subunit beta